MCIGDRIKLHIDEGRRAALGVPEEVGVICDVDLSSNHPAILVHYDSMSVYMAPIAGDEIEVVQPCR